MTKAFLAFLALSLSLPNAPRVNAQTESRLTRAERSIESGEYPTETGLDSREFRTVTGGIFHASGGDMKDLVQFQSRKVAPRTWLVTLPSLVPGEYGFLPPGAILSANASSSLGKMYTFQVRGDAAAPERTRR